MRMRQKAVYFLVFLVALFFLSVEVVKANGPSKITKTTKLEEKMAKIEAELKQMKSEFVQVEKGLSEMKKDSEKSLEKIQKKMVSNEKATKKQMLDNKRIPIPLWLILITVIIFALVGMCVIAEILTRKPPNKRAKS